MNYESHKPRENIFPGLVFIVATFLFDLYNPGTSYNLEGFPFVCLQYYMDVCNRKSVIPNHEDV